AVALATGGRTTGCGIGGRTTGFGAGGGATAFATGSVTGSTGADFFKGEAECFADRAYSLKTDSIDLSSSGV
ncbi:hypothetical protein OGATHE_004210, partial [Ogataea polymorpha]